MRPFWHDLVAAFALLTRLPVGAFVRPLTPPPFALSQREGEDGAAAVWAYPVVGAAVGAVGVVYWLARSLAVPPALAAAWTLAAMIAVTGGLHEDGLADTADGFGGGATRERKLEIMRDSRIGTFGVLAVVLSLGIRGAAIVAIADRGRVVVALIVAGALARAVIVGLLAVLRPARADGLGASVGRPSPHRTAASFLLAAAVAFLLLPATAAALAIAVSAAAGVAVAMLARAQIGGQTGDVLGASEQVAECVVLTVLATAFAGHPA